VAFGVDGNRVLFALHAQVPQAASLKSALSHACWVNDLELEEVLSTEGDVFERMDGVRALIADLTNNDPFVIHDVGIAHALGLPVLCLCHGQQTNQLADLQGERVILYGDLKSITEREELSTTLVDRLRQILGSANPEVIDSFRQRTRIIVHDLELLGRGADVPHQIVWYSGFLSAFSVSEAGLDPDEQVVGGELLREKEALFDLARKGCRIVCIISPPSGTVPVTKARLVATRLKCLRDFIRRHPDLPIDWVLSPYLQKNFYIIGTISCIERFRKEASLRVDVSPRQTGEAAIVTNTLVYRALTERLMQIMLPNGVSETGDPRARMRAATMVALDEALAICGAPAGAGT